MGDGCLEADLNRILCSVEEPRVLLSLAAGPATLRGAVVRIELARPPQPGDTRSTRMRAVQRASGRV
jgi:hypothetical protein